MKKGALQWSQFGLTVFSLMIFCVGTVLVLGIENTPSSATDSAGHTMGFNDHLSREHYGIIVRNFHIGLIFRSENTLGLIPFGVGAFALALFAIPNRKLWKVFYGLQMAFMPVALFGCMILLTDVSAIPNGTMDREGFEDVPFWNALVAAPFWVAASLVALLRIRSGDAALAGRATVSAPAA